MENIVVERGIVNSTLADRFSSNSNCTRGQIVTFLYRGAGENEAE